MSKEIRLVTFQSLDAIKDLFKKGFLEADESKINKEKVGYAYDWISEKMSNVVENPENTISKMYVDYLINNKNDLSQSFFNIYEYMKNIIKKAKKEHKHDRY